MANQRQDNAFPFNYILYILSSITVYFLLHNGCKGRESRVSNLYNISHYKGSDNTLSHHTRLAVPLIDG